MPTLRQKIADLDRQIADAHADIAAARALPFYGSRKASQVQAALLRLADLTRDRERLAGCLERAMGRAA